MTYENTLLEITKIWQQQAYLENKCKDKNVRLLFDGIGKQCELLSCYIDNGFVGSGSAGMGFDLMNYNTKKTREIKSCCTIQNVECHHCKAKYNHIFHDVCPICQCQEFKEFHDSRFSINASETLRQVNENVFDEFLLYHISQIEPSDSQLNLLLTLYSVDFKDESIKSIQMDYFLNQVKLGKKSNCNLLPNSYDFHKLVPHQLKQNKIKINYNDLSQEPIIETLFDGYKECLVNINIISKDMRQNFMNLPSFNSETQCISDKEFTLNFPYKHKSLGKERGDTRTKIDNKLKTGI